MKYKLKFSSSVALAVSRVLSSPTWPWLSCWITGTSGTSVVAASSRAWYPFRLCCRYWEPTLPSGDDCCLYLRPGVSSFVLIASLIQGGRSAKLACLWEGLRTVWLGDGHHRWWSCQQVPGPQSHGPLTWAMLLTWAGVPAS